MEAVEKGWDLMVDTTFPIICGICSIISSVFGIITVTSGSSMMNDMHFHIFVVIWVRLLTLLFCTPKIPFEPNSKIHPIESSFNQQKVKNASAILINQLFFSLELLLYLCANFFAFLFISFGREVNFSIICFIMLPLSVISAMRALQIRPAPPLPPRAIQSPVSLNWNYVCSDLFFFPSIPFCHFYYVGFHFKIIFFSSTNIVSL